MRSTLATMSANPGSPHGPGGILGRPPSDSPARRTRPVPTSPCAEASIPPDAPPLPPDPRDRPSRRVSERPHGTCQHTDTGAGRVCPARSDDACSPLPPPAALCHLLLPPAALQPRSPGAQAGRHQTATDGPAERGSGRHPCGCGGDHRLRRAAPTEVEARCDRFRACRLPSRSGTLAKGAAPVRSAAGRRPSGVTPERARSGDRSAPDGRGRVGARRGFGPANACIGAVVGQGRSGGRATAPRRDAVHQRRRPGGGASCRRRPRAPVPPGRSERAAGSHERRLPGTAAGLQAALCTSAPP